MNPATDHKVDNSIAAVWSTMLPGLGQMMKGQIMPGIFWAMLTGFGYFGYFWPGLFIHAFCILDAALNKGDNSWIGIDTWPKRIMFFGLITVLILYIYYRNV